MSNTGTLNRRNDWRIGKWNVIAIVLAACIGAGSAISSAYYANEHADDSQKSQISADERSDRQAFLRGQRISAYKNYFNHVVKLTPYTETLASLVIDADKPVHGHYPLINASRFDAAYKPFERTIQPLNTDLTVIALVGGGPVRALASKQTEQISLFYNDLDEIHHTLMERDTKHYDAAISSYHGDFVDSDNDTDASNEKFEAAIRNELGNN